MHRSRRHRWAPRHARRTRRCSTLLTRRPARRATTRASPTRAGRLVGRYCSRRLEASRSLCAARPSWRSCCYVAGAATRHRPRARQTKAGRPAARLHRCLALPVQMRILSHRTEVGPAVTRSRLGRAACLCARLSRHPHRPTMPREATNWARSSQPRHSLVATCTRRVPRRHHRRLPGTRSWPCHRGMPRPSYPSRQATRPSRTSTRQLPASKLPPATRQCPRTMERPTFRRPATRSSPTSTRARRARRQNVRRCAPPQPTPQHRQP
mmetsp:Transcript_11521/g.36608  ORF Transcript_11521/g.36608 Transcript_11521/m.36608 type:complete len:267 (+) Transcript_11521:561-1361(+)